MHFNRWLTLYSMCICVFAHSGAYSDFDDTTDLCPDDYQTVISGDEAWCYRLYSPELVPAQGLSFDDAVAACKLKGDTLPIITTLGANYKLGYFRILHIRSDDDVWLGIVCDDNDTYVWQDGQAVNFTEFKNEPEDLCSDSQHFAQNINGEWVPYKNDTKFGYCVCARRAEQMSTTSPIATTCPTGMYPVVPSTGWCYATEFINDASYEDAQKACSRRFFRASLPSINSQQENDAFVYVQTKILHLPWVTAFWIGLKCGDDKKWYWENGEPWSGYTNFEPGNGEPESCDPDIESRYMFNSDYKWENGNGNTAQLVFCTKRAEIVDPKTTASFGSDTTSSFDSERTIEIGTTTDVDSLSTKRVDTKTTSADDSKTTTVVDPDTTTALPTTTTAPIIGLPAWGIVAISAVAILVVVVVITIIVLVWRRFRRLRAEIVEVQQHSGGKAIESQELQGTRYYNLPNKSDEWEIERRFVSIDYMNKLGEGAFGSVHLGRVFAKNIPIGMGRSIAELYELTNNNDTVAVKMLHETADNQAEREFRAEIDLMKAIGFHDRLVNILACVTVNQPILLIIEYCANGDLLEFMRERRTYILENHEDTDNTKTMNVKKQIMFAVQIAYGLEYLSSQGFVHRDIAARNIMVDQQETCKIGDFGLCRAIGKEEENYHSQGGKLPLKWMSPEAIDNYQFSVASDVWSYGVLLFEIVTLGGTPYAGWPASELLHRLKRGERMEKPDNCSANLFDVMTHCWAEVPSDRPSFTKLRKRLGVLLDDVNQDDYYLKLNAQANYYVLESNTS